MIKRIVFSVLTVAMLVSSAEASAQIVVIVNEANPEASLSQGDVRAYFLKMEATWDNGEKVRPIDVTGATPERDSFVADVLGISEGELERHWIERQYASAMQPPTKVPDGASVITLVKSFKGGIGFVSQGVWDAADHAGVKAVFTIGG